MFHTEGWICWCSFTSIQFLKENRIGDCYLRCLMLAALHTTNLDVCFVSTVNNDEFIIVDDVGFNMFTFAAWSGVELSVPPSIKGDGKVVTTSMHGMRDNSNMNWAILSVGVNNLTVELVFVTIILTSPRNS